MVDIQEEIALLRERAHAVEPVEEDDAGSGLDFVARVILARFDAPGMRLRCSLPR